MTEGGAAIIPRVMRAPETVSRLAEFERRGPGTDAERRAARWLAEELSSRGRRVEIETFWCRPNWALAHAWHVALALAGSLVSVSSPRVGGALLLAALISVIADAFLGISPGRRLTPERASQNVVATSRSEPNPNAKRVRLLITANYDAGRTGFAYRNPLRVAAARIRRATGDVAPGWLGWLTIAIAWLLIIAIVRLDGHRSAPVGIAQLVPTVGLVLTLAALIDIAISDCSPAAGDNASGVTVALALTRALDAAPPGRMTVELVLQGAGEGGGIGLRRHLRARKRTLRAANTVVLGIAPSGAGQPRWWLSDGALVPLRYFGRLRQLCSEATRAEPRLAAAAHRGRGATPALPARLARLPAIAIGCLDDRGLVQRSHQQADTVKAVDSASVDAAVQFGLILIDAIDASLANAPRPSVPTPA